MEEGIDESSVWVPCCRMNYEASRFVEHQEVFVFEVYDQRDVFSRNVGSNRVRFVDDDLVPVLYPVCGPSLLAIPPYLAGVDPTANARSCPRWRAVGEEAVQAVTHLVLSHHEPVSAAHRTWRRLIHRCRQMPDTIITTDMNCDVERAPPNTKPRAASPRVHSRAKRAGPYRRRYVAKTLPG